MGVDEILIGKIMKITNIDIRYCIGQRFHIVTPTKKRDLCRQRGLPVHRPLPNMQFNTAGQCCDILDPMYEMLVLALKQILELPADKGETCSQLARSVIVQAA